MTGLWPISLQDTRTPVKMAAISIFVNIVLGVILMWPLRHGGLALATSLASMVNLYLLVRALKKKVGLINWRDILLSVRKTVVCSAVMGIAVFAAALIFIPQAHAGFVHQLFGLLGTIFIGIGSYAGCSYLAKCPEAYDLIKMIGARTKPQEQVSK